MVRALAAPLGSRLHAERRPHDSSPEKPALRSEAARADWSARACGPTSGRENSGAAHGCSRRTARVERKRIRRDPRVLVAESSFRGRERGPRLDGDARIVDDVNVQKLIRERCGWQKRLELLSRGGPDTSVTIAIVDA